MTILCHVGLPKEPLGLLASTGYLLARVGTESRRAFAQALDEHHVTLAEFGVLMILGELRTTPQRGLGEAAGIDPRNLVPILDGLEQRDLLRRGPDDKDRRRHAVVLSPAGRRLLDELAAAGERAEDALLRPLDAAERRQLNRLLSRLLP
jgi:DNA-binding MarR family transcriptional regulator